MMSRWWQLVSLSFGVALMTPWACSSDGVKGTGASGGAGGTGGTGGTTTDSQSSSSTTAASSSSGAIRPEQRGQRVHRERRLRPRPGLRPAHRQRLHLHGRGSRRLLHRVLRAGQRLPRGQPVSARPGRRRHLRPPLQARPQARPLRRRPLRVQVPRPQRSALHAGPREQGRVPAHVQRRQPVPRRPGVRSARGHVRHPGEHRPPHRVRLLPHVDAARLRGASA